MKFIFVHGKKINKHFIGCILVISTNGTTARMQEVGHQL
jgi:hypothetical protein